MSSGTIISEATHMCLQSFTVSTAVEDLMRNDWAEDRLADLNLWISNTGALAGGRASLDHRLRSKPEACGVIANLLCLLAGAMGECRTLGQTISLYLLVQLLTRTRGLSVRSGAISNDNDEEYSAYAPPENLPERSFSPWSDDSTSDDSMSDEQPEKQLEQPSLSNPVLDNMQSVETMLDQLTRIGISVRQSGRRSRLQRADHLFKPEEHVDLQTHLTTIILARAEFSQEQINPSNLSEIQQRLIHCNLKRRNRFLYAQQHSIRLKSTPTPSTPARIIDRIAISFKEEQESISTPSNLKSLNRASDASKNSTIRTGTNASAPSESFVLPQDPLPAAAVSTVVSSTAVDLKYPRPPKTKDVARVFTCPCCCQVLPVAVMEGNKWKKHIADDLCPYTCILPNCDNPTALFTTAQQWRQHLLKGHSNYTYWICFSCDGRIQFHAEEAFIDHIKGNHAATIPPHQIPLLTDISKRSAPLEITSCPLCDWPAMEGEGAPIDKNVLLDHIAKDLHSFSLRSLPWADDNGQETDERISYSSNKVYDWIVKHNLSYSPNEDRPSLEGKVYSSTYFQQNPYFAESSASSSSSTSQSLASWEEELKKWKQEDSAAFENETGSLIAEDAESEGSGTDNLGEKSEPKYKEMQASDYQAVLSIAPQEWDLATVEMHIREGGNIEARDVFNRTPLIWAAQHGNEDIAKLLIEMRADMEAMDKTGLTPLLSAVLRGDKNMAERLLESGAKKENVGLLLEKGAYNTGGWDKATPLLWATRGGNRDIARLLLEKGANIEARDRDGRTPLLLAVYCGDKDIARLLLEKGANIEARDRDGRTPLLSAAYCGKEALVKLLLESGAEMEVKDKDFHTPLTWAVYERTDGITNLLLEKGANTEVRDESGWTPLLSAVYYGKDAIVKLLIEHGADIEAKDRGGWTPLLSALYYGKDDIARLLIMTGANVRAKSEDGWTPLLLAAYHSEEAISKMLIELGADIEARDNYERTPLLIWIGYSENAAVIGMLLKKGVNIEATGRDGQTPLQRAAYFEQTATVKLLLDYGANLDARDGDGRTPFLWAICHEKEAIANLLFETGRVDINAKDKYNKTPTSYAATDKNSELVQRLLGTGKVNLFARENWLPLLRWATAKGKEETIMALVDEEKDLDHKDEEVKEALWHAAYEKKPLLAEALLEKGVAYSEWLDQVKGFSLAIFRGNLETVESLLSNGADPDFMDEWGAWPLHWAAYNGHEAITKLLLTRQVDVNVTNPDGRTPLHLAAIMEHDSIYKLLLDAGANASIRDRWSKVAAELSVKRTLSKRFPNSRRYSN